MSIDQVVADIGHDPDSLEAFYREHLERIQRFVARRVFSPADAADLTADVFLEAVRSCHRYRVDFGSPTAWLYGIARNVVASHHRSAGRAVRAHDRFSARDWLDDDSTERITDRIDAEKDARAVFASLENLPDRQRAVVELVAVDGLGLNEAGAVLGISATNARVRYHRARQRLAQSLPNVFEVNP